MATRPGCVAFAENEELALLRIAAALDEYEHWLSPVSVEATASSKATLASTERRTSVRVLGRVNVAEPLVHGNTAAFFDWDKQIVTIHEIETTFEMLSRSRKRLLDVAHGIGEARWSERPGGGMRTVVDVLHHVARGEWWYVSRIVDFPFPDSAAQRVVDPVSAVCSPCYSL